MSDALEIDLDITGTQKDITQTLETTIKGIQNIKRKIHLVLTLREKP